MNAPRDEMPCSPGGDAQSKVVRLRPDKPVRPPERLDPRLDELRRLLAQSEPISGPYSDEEVIDDEDKFRKRFGPGFRWSRRDRTGLIALKTRYDLTDSEIKLFHYTGNLHRSVFGVRLTTSSWIAIGGGVHLAILGPMLLLLLAGTMLDWRAETSIVLSRLMAILGLSTICYGIYWLYVKPWRIQRRKEREQSVDGSSRPH